MTSSILNQINDIEKERRMNAHSKEYKKMKIYNEVWSEILKQFESDNNKKDKRKQHKSNSSTSSSGNNNGANGNNNQQNVKQGGNPMNNNA